MDPSLPDSVLNPLLQIARREGFAANPVAIVNGRSFALRLTGCPIIVEIDGQKDGKGYLPIKRLGRDGIGAYFFNGMYAGRYATDTFIPNQDHARMGGVSGNLFVRVSGGRMELKTKYSWQGMDDGENTWDIKCPPRQPSF